MYGKINIKVECGTQTFHEPRLRSGKPTKIQEASSASKDVVKKSHVSNTVMQP